MSNEKTHEALVAAARLALSEMCRTSSPRASFTEAVDKLDEALDAIDRLATPAPDVSADREALAWLITSPDGDVWANSASEFTPGVRRIFEDGGCKIEPLVLATQQEPQR